MIRIKRAYDPATRNDGKRFLVERLWPRGMRKDHLEMDAWLKDAAPSTQLRRWFGHRPERWGEFRRRYQRELSANPSAWWPIVEASKRYAVTLLYSAHDVEHNGAVALRDYLVVRTRRSARSRVAPPSHPGTRKRAVHLTSSHRELS